MIKLKLALLWVLSGIFTLFGIDHKQFQREMVDKMDRDFYLKHSKKLLVVSVEEYDEIIRVYNTMREIALTSPTLYLSVKNIIQYSEDLKRESEK